jgi:hypothetical protein
LINLLWHHSLIKRVYVAVFVVKICYDNIHKKNCHCRFVIRNLLWPHS